MMPGGTLHRLGSALCSPDMRERVIDAFVADFQREWCDATTPRQRASATVRAWGSFAGILAGCLVHDAQHDFARCAARVLKFGVPVTVSLGSIFWPSWRETGQIDWIDAAYRFVWMGAYTAALLIASHRSQHSERPALLPFYVFVGGAVSALVFHPGSHGRQPFYQWIFMIVLTLALPFLIRMKPGSVIKSSHRH